MIPIPIDSDLKHKHSMHKHCSPIAAACGSRLRLWQQPVTFKFVSPSEHPRPFRIRKRNARMELKIKKRSELLDSALQRPRNDAASSLLQGQVDAALLQASAFERMAFCQLAAGRADYLTAGASMEPECQASRGGDEHRWSVNGKSAICPKDAQGVTTIVELDSKTFSTHRYGRSPRPKSESLPARTQAQWRKGARD